MAGIIVLWGESYRPLDEGQIRPVSEDDHRHGCYRDPVRDGYVCYLSGLRDVFIPMEHLDAVGMTIGEYARTYYQIDVANP